MEHFDLKQVRYMQSLIWVRDPPLDVGGFRASVQQSGDSRRRIEDDQRTSAEIAGIVRVAHPADRYFRRLV